MYRYRRVMPRLPRTHLQEDGIFHVTGLGTGGCDIYCDDVDRLIFTDIFWTTVLAFDWECIVVCLMGTNYHAVVTARRERFSEGMQKLNGAYARRFNVRYGRRGHLFADRFSSRVVDTEHHLNASIEYVIWNPVRAGLCDFPDEWPWTWLARSRAETSFPTLVPSSGGDSPMGQALRRARERQRRPRPLKRMRAWPERTQARALRNGREQDEL